MQSDQDLHCLLLCQQFSYGKWTTKRKTEKLSTKATIVMPKESWNIDSFSHYEHDFRFNNDFCNNETVQASIIILKYIQSSNVKK